MLTRSETTKAFYVRRHVMLTRSAGGHIIKINYYSLKFKVLPCVGPVSLRWYTLLTLCCESISFATILSMDGNKMLRIFSVLLY